MPMLGSQLPHRSASVVAANIRDKVMADVATIRDKVVADQQEEIKELLEENKRLHEKVERSRGVEILGKINDGKF
jgi:hypothetical protein